MFLLKCKLDHCHSRSNLSNIFFLFQRKSQRSNEWSIKFTMLSIYFSCLSLSILSLLPSAQWTLASSLLLKIPVTFSSIVLATTVFIYLAAPPQMSGWCTTSSHLGFHSNANLAMRLALTHNFKLCSNIVHLFFLLYFTLQDLSLSKNCVILLYFLLLLISFN